MITERTYEEAALLIAEQGGCNGIACCDCIFYHSYCPESPEAMRSGARAWLSAQHKRKRVAA